MDSRASARERERERERESIQTSTLTARNFLSSKSKSLVSIRVVYPDVVKDNTCRLRRFCYERFYVLLPSVLGNTRRGAQFIKAYANDTMLTLPTHSRTAHLVVFKISTYANRSDLIWLDPKNSATHFNGRTSITVFFNIPKFSGHIFWVWRHPPTQFPPTVSLSGSL